jgi:predicted nucleotidyltransferase
MAESSCGGGNGPRGGGARLSGRIDIARVFAEEQIKRDPSIIGVILTGSAARNDAVAASDVDVQLLVGGSDVGYAERGDLRTWRDGVLIDAECHPIADYGDARRLLKEPYLAGQIRDAVILFDRDGALVEVQRVVADQFMEPRWLRARLSSLMPAIERNFREFVASVKAHDHVGVCRASVFALWTICDALLVGQGVSPSWVRGLQKLGEVLPQERERIIDIEGSTAMMPDTVSGFVPMFEQVIGPGPGPVMQHVQGEIVWMIHNDLHQEAFHSLWAGFALALRRQAESGEAGIGAQAQALARRWLTEAHWHRDALKTKESQLGHYVGRIDQLAATPGQQSCCK